LSDVNLLPERFNVTKRKYHDSAVLNSKEIESDDVVIFHYVGEKPWVSDKHSATEYSYLKAEFIWHQTFKTLTSYLLGINCNYRSKFTN
jgi:lipopolysaccharide biosynthesis glycosyltransferase